MKYFGEGDILLSDFDGVYLNSQVVYNEVMQGKTDLNSWMDYLNSIDWHKFLRECERVPEAKETFLELQKLGILKGFITRIHSFYEGIEKTHILREDGIMVPIYFVLPEQPKSDIYKPTQHTIIVEDDYRNAQEWEQNGGKAYLYNPNLEMSTNHEVKKLSHLLKK